MAYTTELRDHVWFVQSDGTAGGVTIGAGASDAQERINVIRWIPATNADTITISRFDEDGNAEVVWESQGDGATVAPEESTLELRLTRGFKVIMSNGGKLYLYERLSDNV